MPLSEVSGSYCHEIFHGSTDCEGCPFPKTSHGELSAESMIDAQSDLRQFDTTEHKIHMPLFDEEGELKGIAHIIQDEKGGNAHDGGQICRAAESAINNFIDKNRKAIRDNLATILFGIDAVSSILREDKDLETVSRPVTKAAEQLDRIVCTLLDFQETDKDS
ncbi:MAG: hypothetical protein D3924_14890 [Candidatus Electrothrix sp. AR4]|nr:hypothetical protein [Candidatus Electrothrix sp. AR4]